MNFPIKETFSFVDQDSYKSSWALKSSKLILFWHAIEYRIFRQLHGIHNGSRNGTRHLLLSSCRIDNFCTGRYGFWCRRNSLPSLWKLTRKRENAGECRLILVNKCTLNIGFQTKHGLGYEDGIFFSIIKIIWSASDIQRPSSALSLNNDLICFIFSTEASIFLSTDILLNLTKFK